MKFLGRPRKEGLDIRMCRSQGYRNATVRAANTEANKPLLKQKKLILLDLLIIQLIYVAKIHLLHFSEQ